MYYLYILHSTVNGKYYIGVSSNVVKRVSEHNHGNSRSTKSGKPWKVIHKECFEDFRLAYAREKKLKALKKRAAIERIIMRARSSAG
jgi:putative endonuclease